MLIVTLARPITEASGQVPVSNCSSVQRTGVALGSITNPGGRSVKTSRTPAPDGIIVAPLKFPRLVLKPTLTVNWLGWLPAAVAAEPSASVSQAPRPFSALSKPNGASSSVTVVVVVVVAGVAPAAVTVTSLGSRTVGSGRAATSTAKESSKASPGKMGSGIVQVTS